MLLPGFYYESVSQMKRVRKRQFSDSNDDEIKVSSRNKFKTQSFTPIIGKLVGSLSRTSLTYEERANMFQFLIHIEATKIRILDIFNYLKLIRIRDCNV